ncbi:DUF3078 domain-containing protein [Chryseobacterium sp. CCH4-E10]|uniref:DUF3078 domain-containing protein n=1 Tax=Chryseobacterium sp. CCH4-E10 TaxID=1768758 RepID=UPI000836278F|nr:DUF3078 domain-containing protein [Chryseobacterium sp. CCH4-E10]
MKNKILPMVLFISTFMMGQQNSEEDSLKHWSLSGYNNFHVNQAAFSHWNAGGHSNIGWNARVNYQLTYKENKELFQNIVIIGYGGNKLKGEAMRKTQDELFISSNYGRQIYRNWYGVFGSSLSTQFAPGYLHGNPNGRKISNYMAPGYAQVAIGAMFHKNENFYVEIKPLVAKWTFVLDRQLQVEGNYGLKHNGAPYLFQLGSFGSCYYRVRLFDNVTLTNSGSFFSNYLEHPERLVLNYNGELNMKINNYLSTLVTLDVKYDHYQTIHTQLKEILSLGLTYNIHHRF